MDAKRNAGERVESRNIRDSRPDVIGMYDSIIAELDTYRLTTGQITAMKSKTLKWRCWVEGCTYEIPVKPDHVEAIPFLIVRHLYNYHGMLVEEIMDAEPTLTAELRDYCRTMGIEAPVTADSGTRR